MSTSELSLSQLRMKGLINLPDNKDRRAATEAIVKDLWNILHHPPTSYVGDNDIVNPDPGKAALTGVKTVRSEPTVPAHSQQVDENHLYRHADGSHNNLANPDLGKAGTIYAKTVPTESITPIKRPDAGELFDELMARGDNFEPNKAGFSSLFYCHAIIITHDIFHTDSQDSNLNKASSYLDLAPLYGNNEVELAKIRSFKNGELKPDTFCDKRALGLPPAICVMLVMYSRFHNYAARTLAAINEDERFTLPDSADEVAIKKRDNELFQVARLITNGLYMNICVNDYVRAIFNVNHSVSNWGLNPQAEIEISDHEMFPRGVGNQVSCEFNLLYRFHSAMSEGDAKWSTEFFSQIFPGKDISKLSLGEFLEGLKKHGDSIPIEPSTRTFAGLTRKSDGTFNDKALVKILKDAIDDPAGAFGPKHIPKVLKPIEMMGIIQARKWKVASLNEFRKFIAETPYTKFSEINKDEKIAKTLERLYGHVDNVELYPGLFLENTLPELGPGTGISVPETVTKAILADAVSLVRGDRHMTLDFTPKALTKWGIAEVASDSKTLGGAKMHHLILTAFPGWFEFNSVHAMQPFYTPEKSREIFTKFGIETDFSFNTPSSMRQPILITSHAAVKQVLEKNADFKVPWAESKHLTTYMLSGDTPANAKQRELVQGILHSNGEGAIQQFTNFAKLITLSLLKKNAKPGGGSVYQIDIVKDLGNPVTLQFASILCYLPLQFEHNPDGSYTETDLYEIFTKLIEFIFYNVDPTKTWALRRDLKDAMPKLKAAIKAKIQTIETPEPASNSPGCQEAGGQSDADSTASAIRTFGTTFTKQVRSAGTSIDEATEILVGNGVAIIGTVGLVFAQIVDYYLKPENASHWSQIVKFSKQNDQAGDKKLHRYILEGVRLCGVMGSVRNVDPADGKPIELAIDQAGNKVSLNKGDRIITSFGHASRDPSVFPNPDELNLERPLDSYVTFSFGPHKCIGREIGTACLLVLLKSVAQLQNVRRAAGNEGDLKIVTRPNGFRQFMTLDGDRFSPFPTTMKLEFDDLQEDN